MAQLYYRYSTMNAGKSIEVIKVAFRSKIEADGGAPYIKTVYGMGYQWTGGEVK